MNTPGFTNDDRDQLAAYVDGNRSAVLAAAPREPAEPLWDQVRDNIEQQLTCGSHYRRTVRTRLGAHLAGIALIGASAAAIAWLAIHLALPKAPRNAEVVEMQPGTGTPERNQVSPVHAAIEVLPIAAAEDVVLHRVPGAGLLPVGTHPIAEAISLATIDDVQMDEENASQQGFCVTEGGSPMIFAARPR